MLIIQTSKACIVSITAEQAAYTDVAALLLVYAASTATTLLPCLANLLSDVHEPALTSTQLLMLLSSYLPFLLVPVAMAVDMAVRLGRAIQVAERVKTE